MFPVASFGCIFWFRIVEIIQSETEVGLAGKVVLIGWFSPRLEDELLVKLCDSWNLRLTKSKEIFRSLPAPTGDRPLFTFHPLMNSDSERTGGHSPVRRRLIALAGAGGLAGLAGVLWPRNEASVAADKIASPKTPVSAADRLVEPQASALEPGVAASSSSVASERELMAQHLGEVFTVKQGGSVKLVLDQVGGLMSQSGQGRRFEGYSLLFKIESGALGDDGVFRLSHPALGELDFYLGSVCGPITPARYEAVISRAV